MDHESNAIDEGGNFSKQRESMRDLKPSIKYQFQNWGWLGNQYLKQSNFKMPSWKQIQGHIIKEQTIKIKEEVL